jgi:hypothetical protein
MRSLRCVFAPVLAACLGLGCSGAPPDVAGDPSGAPSRAEPISTTQSASAVLEGLELCCGTTQVLVDGVAAAENLIFTEEGRLFVTGDNGVFELRRDASGAMQAMTVASAPYCKFSGLAEVGTVLYAACYDLTDSYLFAAALTPTPQFERIDTMTGVQLANGLAADTAGNLYVAATIQGEILRLTTAPGDPFTVSSLETWLPNSGVLTDGLKFFASSLFWTSGGTISRVPILANGAAGSTSTVVTRLTIFDDLFVSDAGGILAADYTAGALDAFDLYGLAVGQTTTPMTNPSALAPALGRVGFGPNDIVFTEKGANRVSVFRPVF